MQRQGTARDVFSKGALKQYGAELGLNTSQFNACVDGDQHLEAVYQDVAEGRSKGVNSTPTFFINGQKVEGAADYEQFKTIIDGLLANSAE
jgi:predicted DsbA family dithiol-disulfide isomerase